MIQQIVIDAIIGFATGALGYLFCAWIDRAATRYRLADIRAALRRP